MVELVELVMALMAATGRGVLLWLAPIHRVEVEWPCCSKDS